jgi:hypothetical protein
MTGYWGSDNRVLSNGPADWISPGATGPTSKESAYEDNPPGADGKKVVVLDTDHIFGVGGGRDWAWKSFLRGYNPIWMDPYETPSVWEPVPGFAAEVRRGLGETRRFAERMDLAAMVPHPVLGSTGYCLAKPGSEYLFYRPTGGQALSVELRTGTYRYEWFNPATGTSSGGGLLDSSGGAHHFKAPFEGDAVLYLKAQ